MSPEIFIYSQNALKTVSWPGSPKGYTDYMAVYGKNRLEGGKWRMGSKKEENANRKQT